MSEHRIAIMQVEDGELFLDLDDLKSKVRVGYDQDTGFIISKDENDYGYIHSLTQPVIILEECYAFVADGTVGGHMLENIFLVDIEDYEQIAVHGYCKLDDVCYRYPAKYAKEYVRFEPIES